MSLRHIKPQAALIATTHTQIGKQAMLGVSVGMGFRLSAPSMLVHEAAIWEALKAAPASFPLTEAAMPKKRAEWLLMGHSTYRIPAGRRGGHVDWVAQIEIDGVRKTLSCRTAGPSAPSLSGDSIVRLPLDAAQAYAGLAGDNPYGTSGIDAPLQRIGMLGASPMPLAATGPIGMDWPERAQWAPARPASIDAMADDGTHMGWPQHTDLRLFQLAAPDQWSNGEAWSPGARFVLSGFGPLGNGYAGTLPQLEAVALLTRTNRSGVERLTLRQQTVWFLPDHDIGVLWWNGTAALDYVLDDAPKALVVAFKDRQETIDTDALMAFAAQRIDLNDRSPEQQLDHALMPALDRGWIWEMILDVDDHPRFSPSPRTHAEHAARLEQYRGQLVEAQEAQTRLEAFRTSVASSPLPEIPPDERDWLETFRTSETRKLTGEIVRDVDFSSITLEGWQFDEVRFERCKFDGGTLRHCSFENSHATDCSLLGTTLDSVIWKGGTIVRGALARSIWLQSTLERINLEDCGFDEIQIKSGAWVTVSIQGRGGARGIADSCVWRGVSWHGVAATHWHWLHLDTENLGLVECDLRHLALTRCTLLKASMVKTDLSSTLWQHSAMSLSAFSEGGSLAHAHFSDCTVRSSSFQQLMADEIRVDHCTFAQFTAQRLHAKSSSWSATLLETANLTHADFSNATFEHCSLKEAMLYGADLSDTRVYDCNLIQSRTSWALTPVSGAWRANLEGGRIAVPRRFS